MPAHRLGIVGCGGATLKLHLPALVNQEGFRLVALVDTVLPHARAAADRYRALTGDAILATDDLTGVLEQIDAAIVASSSGTHAGIAVTLLSAGKHALVEKPMALTLAECERIRIAAAAGGATVIPGHVRRLFPLTPWIKSVVDSGRLGPVRRVGWSEGSPFEWGVSSAAMFGPMAAGGGVLADTGPHVLDTLCHWFGDSPEITRVLTNGAGGCDSEVEIGLSFGDTVVDVRLSRLRQLTEQIVIEGVDGSLTVDPDLEAGYLEVDRSGAIRASGTVPALPEAAGSWETLFARQLTEFGRAIAGADTPLATFDNGVAVARVLEVAREVATHRLPRPWMDARPLPDRRGSDRIAITGATGFIGAHVVERMAAAPGTHVVAVARNLRKLARLSHVDHDRVRYARADIRDRAALEESFRGCDVVVHTVYGTSGDAAERWSVTVDGTAAMLDAARAAGVRRVVHLSTMDVYAPVPGTTLDESCPRLQPVPGARGSYKQQKLAAEDLVLAATGGPEVVSLQPTIVYGPWGPTWTISVLAEDLLTANHTLPTGPDTGICNALHVHDLADAIAFAATAPGLDRLRLLVSGPETIGWGAFYDAHRQLLGVGPPKRYDSEQVDPADRALYAGRVVVSTDRLAGLGFRPRIGIKVGLHQLAGWAAWAGLIPG